MKFFIALFFTMAVFSAQANMEFFVSGAIPLEKDNLASHNCPGKTNKEEINGIIRDLISDYFPSLNEDYKDNRIKMREFTNDQYFMKTFFKLGHVLKDKRIYFVDINTKLYSCSPTKEALVAILAHELKHIDDYKNLKSFGLIKLGLKMVRKKPRSKYERETDYFVMELGLANGIKEYRNWIYDQLTEKALKKKKCYYYTPEEINRFLQGERDFTDYFNKYCKN